MRLPVPSQGFCSLILFPCVAPIFPLNFHHNFWDYHSVFIDFYRRFEDFRRKLQHRHIKIINRWESSRGGWGPISTFYWGSLCLWPAFHCVSLGDSLVYSSIYYLFIYSSIHSSYVSYLGSGFSDFTNALPPKTNKWDTFLCYTLGNITSDCQGFWLLSTAWC